MIQRAVTISAPHGLHTRPAALLVKAAQDFPCTITVLSQGRQASAKSLFRLQTLDLRYGTEITLQAEGEQAEQAIDRLSDMLSDLK
ncbi:HPr family phosphocarrier protein [Ferrimonas marina]|uniref:Phosphocarrier protein HPr n=1 Tax=Ferrimonas marina TaxID=299255 RepID=A0A1M5YV12_9GAMM|nr:HPr family phosphocarrier protein [Ferrimonas marina]SHI15916.1 phosphocarrier protein HPr [Ferrimonas marina]